MLTVAWILLSCAAWCAASSLAPVPAALEAPASNHNTAVSDGSQPQQEKGLLNYLLPPTSSWGPTHLESSKRGYNKNYLRFGRSEEEKRGRNFLRFGRGDSNSAEESDSISADSEDSIEKRNRNFLRFGRDRNFLRFGRSDIEEFGLPGGPLAFANGIQEEDIEEYPVEDKRAGHRNYLRFGRGNRNFLRFGRNDNRNFLRFGRSVDRQLNEQKEEQDALMTPTTGPHTAAKTQQESHRTKRAAGSYSYVVMPSHGPSAWAQDYQPDQEDEDLDVAVEGPEVDKRAYNRNFVRFGRNRNFLRFGKRNDDDSAEMMMVRPDSIATFPRMQRSPQRNFLRFG